MGGNRFMLIYHDNNNGLVAVGELSELIILTISMFHFGLNVQSNVTTAKLTAAKLIFTATVY